MLTLKRFFKLTKSNTRLFIGAIVMAGFASLTNLMTPQVIKVTVDSILGGQPLDTIGPLEWLIGKLGGMSVLARSIWMCSIAVVLISICNGIFVYFRGKWTATGAENIAKKLKDDLYDHLQKLPYEYHVKAQTGDLIQRCTSDVDTVRRFFAAQMVEVARTVFIVTLSMIILCGIHWRLALLSVAITPFTLLFSYFFFKKNSSMFKKFDEKEGELSTVLQENLSGVRVVRAFGRQKHEVDKFETKNEELRGLGVNVCDNMASFWSLSDFLCMTQISIVLFAGAYLTVNGEISLGSFIVFNSYVNMLVFPMRQLGRILSDMGKMGVSIGRIFEVLNTPAETDTEGAQKHPLRGEIVFDDVNFHYEKNNPVLKGLSFTIKPGETVAILGSTGSGKSTVMHLLFRLYDYNEGSIRINGRELRDIEKKWLRERIGIVLQEPFLYSKTVMENIKMARFGAEAEEVYDAARTASVHEVIEGFERGYDTIVGEKGVTLSGGQKQRVAIARTLIKNSDILIFDDSLSAVDTETDAQIRASLKEKQADVTTFIISQRINTLMEADRILVIENGALSDAGTHAELIERPGLYSRIWNIQNMLEEEFEEEVV